jgi:hypothetical protein
VIAEFPDDVVTHDRLSAGAAKLSMGGTPTFVAARVLVGVIMKITHDPTESEDILQEVLIQVWDRILTRLPKDSFPAG